MLTVLSCCAALYGAPSWVESTVIRYVANAGVMLTIDGTTVLIDAPIREGIPPYATASADEQRRLERATAPYDVVDAILVTHWHEDHFSADAILEHLRHNRRAVLISSREVVDRVRARASDLADRFVGLTPQQGDSAVVSVGALKVHVLRARHNPTRRWPEEHVAFLVEGSQTALHTGDAELTPENFAVLRRLPKVNIALLPYWHLLNEKTLASTVVPLIRADRVLGMHLPRADAEKARRELQLTMPAAVLLVEPGTDVPARPPGAARQ
jgi:L-ascorbate metabolism protein UlaG (beta-lactamase superfamily)